MNQTLLASQQCWISSAALQSRLQQIAHYLLYTCLGAQLNSGTCVGAPWGPSVPRSCVCDSACWVRCKMFSLLSMIHPRWIRCKTAPRFRNASPKASAVGVSIPEYLIDYICLHFVHCFDAVSIVLCWRVVRRTPLFKCKYHLSLLDVDILRFPRFSGTFHRSLTEWILM